MPEHRANRPDWKFWEYERNHAMYCAIRPGDVIVDVGAEEGDLSALYTSWSKTSPILIEPSPKMWPWIKQTFEANQLPDPTCFLGFAGDKTNVDSWSSTWPPDIETYPDPGFAHLNENDGTLATVKLDDLVDKCDIITIDVEGGEYNVMLGAKELLARCRPIVFISIHPEFLRDRYNMTSDDLMVLMEHHYGYTGTYLGFDHEYHWIFKP